MVTQQSFLKPFHGIPGIEVDNEVQTAASQTTCASPILPDQPEQNTRMGAQVTLNDANTLLLIPQSDTLLVNKVSEDALCDDKISSAVQQLETAIKEVESAGRNLQACVKASNAQSQKEAAERRQVVDCCQQELKDYKERCANAEDCERKLRQH